MTLARASSSDTDINHVEVESVVAIVARETGESVTTADVRVAAASELYETARLDQYLGKVGRKLKSEERSRILTCLAEVIRSDVRVSPREVSFFNWIAEALQVTPADIVGLFDESEST
jgi:uncharacterized tellurite resistance protein B-like protein